MAKKAAVASAKKTAEKAVDKASAPVKAKAAKPKASPKKAEAKAAASASASIAEKTPREFDVVLFGASSFVGKYVAQHLQRRAQETGLRWAIAGRSAAKLAAIKLELGAPELPVVLAEAHDAAALADLAGRTKAIASTVGPYALYGSELVAACAAQGTDYCDLTAEIPWVRRMMNAHGATAAKTGARIVHGCGFDSIPSDLGTWFLQQRAQDAFGAPCSFVKMRLKKASGGFSGGTIASLTDMVTTGAADAEVRQLLLNPYALMDYGSAGSQKDKWLAAYDRDAREWRAPFIMAPINSRVVQRTNFLLGLPWGVDFVYDEAMLTGSGPLGAVMAGGVTAALGGLVGMMALKPTRAILQKVLPAPGEGPSLKAIENGFFEMHAYGRTASGEKIKAIIRGKRDPGYGATSRMLAEASMSLALDRDESSVGGGFWTPATAMGQKLLDRLEAHAGMSFSVV
ncbi:MAG: saccharopine dehydrogenase family protein [Moraxellaceae bacterium]